MVKKILTWGALAFVVFYTVTQPENAAAVFKTIGGLLKDIGEGLGDFLSILAQ